MSPAKKPAKKAVAKKAVAKKAVAKKAAPAKKAATSTDEPVEPDLGRELDPADVDLDDFPNPPPVVLNQQPPPTAPADPPPGPVNDLDRPPTPEEVAAAEAAVALINGSVDENSLRGAQRGLPITMGEDVNYVLSASDIAMLEDDDRDGLVAGDAYPAKVRAVQGDFRANLIVDLGDGRVLEIGGVQIVRNPTSGGTPNFGKAY